MQYSASYAANKGRLNHQTTYIAKRNDKGQWFQVDFGKIVKITTILTQGRHNAAQWVTKFIVSYSLDGGYFSFQLHHPYNVPRVKIYNSFHRKIHKVKLFFCSEQFEL